MEPFRKLISGRAYVLGLLEAGMVALCFGFATFLNLPMDAGIYLQYESGGLRIAIVAFTFFTASYLFDFYKQIRVRSRLVLALQLCQLTGIIFLVQAAFGFVNPDLVLPPWVVITGSVLMLPLLILSRLFLHPVIWRAIGARKILFVGFNKAVQNLAEAFTAQPALGMTAAGYLTESGTAVASDALYPILGSYKDLMRIAVEIKPDRIIVGNDNAHNKDLLHALFNLKSRGVVIETAGQMYEATFGRIYSRGLEPYTVIFRNELAASPGSVALQSIYNNLIAIAAVIVTLPIMLLIAVALRFTRRGPVLAKHPCIGLHGVPFNMYRFRCSFSGSDRLSRFLLKFKLEGLPQALNVARGEMSIIGPRPERVEFDAALSELIPFYRQRQYVKPGILGWSQLHCDAEPDEDTLARLEYDLYYIKHISLVLDAYILLRALKWLFSERESTSGELVSAGGHAGL